MYYPVNGKSYFLENKEIILEKGQIKTGKNNIYHKIEDSIGQAEVIIIDTSNSGLTDRELLDRIDVVFNTKDFKNYRKILIIKKENHLFGIFTDK